MRAHARIRPFEAYNRVANVRVHIGVLCSNTRAVFFDILVGQLLAVAAIRE